MTTNTLSPAPNPVIWRTHRIGPGQWTAARGHVTALEIAPGSALPYLRARKLANKLNLATGETSVPLCPEHKTPMVERGANDQTPEQAFCGTWFACTACTQKVLHQSPAMIRQLFDMAPTTK